MSTRANVYVGDPDNGGWFIGYFPGDAGATGSIGAALIALGESCDAGRFEEAVRRIIDDEYSCYGAALFEEPVDADYEYALISGYVLARSRPQWNRPYGGWRRIRALAAEERRAAERRELRLVARYDQLCARVAEAMPWVYFELDVILRKRSLSVCARARILELVADPTAETWDAAAGMLIVGSRTLWNAVLAVDPAFPRYGRTTNDAGAVVREWEKIPGRDLVLQALRRAVMMAYVVLN